MGGRIGSLKADLEEEGGKSEERESKSVGKKREGKGAEDERDEEDDDGSLSGEEGRRRKRSHGPHLKDENSGGQGSPTGRKGEGFTREEMRQLIA